MNKAFIDTNLAIALIFYINSLHPKAKRVFSAYSEFIWSKFVKNEFNQRYTIKQNHLKSFFNDLRKYLENPNQELYSSSDLKEFARKRYSAKKMDDAISSINPFWNHYIGIESQIPFFKMKQLATICLKDLTFNTVTNKKKLENMMQVTPERTNNYQKINKMLKLEGVSAPDRHVTLDGHDFACLSSDPIDFVTFDENCCNGAKNVPILCFNNVKGKYDFDN